MTLPVALGPWAGIDNVHDDHHEVFQPSEERPARLVTAEDIDLDDSGSPAQREEFASRLSLTTGLNVFSGLGLVLVQDDTTIKSLDTSTNPYGTTTLASGLTAARAEFYELGDKIFWHNGSEMGTVYADESTGVWGLPAPAAPTLGAVSGSLRAGRYMVAVTYIDAKGIEHGTQKSGVITITANQDITVNLTPDSNAVSVKIYCTRPNGTQLFWVATVAVGSLPATISDVEVSTEPLQNQYLSPPIAPTCIFAYRGLLMLGVSNAVLPSVGIKHHLFDIGRVAEYFPYNVQAGVGLKNGFWTATERGLYWTTGDEPSTWNTGDPVDNRKYSKGAKRIPGRWLPQLGITEDVALFVSEDGLVIGFPDGRVLAPHHDQQVLDVTGKRASIIYRRLPSGSGLGRLAQILYTLV